MKDAARFLAGLGLAALMLWWVLRRVELGMVWQESQRVSFAGVVGAAVLVVASNLARSWRWRVLLEPVREGVRFGPLFVAVVLGQAMSIALPGRLGELARPALLSGRERLPLAPCLGSMVSDRLLDGLTILGLWAVALQLAGPGGEGDEISGLVKGASLAVLAATLGALGLLLGISATRKRLEKWLEGRRGWLPWLLGSMLGFSRGIEALREPRLLGRLGFHSLVLWALVGGGTWLGVRACGAVITPQALFVILPLLVLGIALPTPGGAGGYHAAMTFGLVLFGVAEPVAVTASLIVHLAVTVPILLVAGLLLGLDRELLADLAEAVRQARRSAARAREPGSAGSAPET